ncbi:hypothetical protein SAMN04487948_103298 [Halogranum amylolyticum]|uniref:Nudix hydrolase domain-containing protein n=1 Tax=Halogranum amylolyticum TaxID=660520 RepID=A0A1H8QT05_9EURY|nr:hypothetical protein [Halogranum amylolyticum]SEO57350.1 hypothetical protein SAMN04487948_103298 [Halogranum amylolyticum]
MDSLSDPNALRTRSDVAFSEERTVDDREGFDYFAAIGGLVVVGITNHTGAVLLMDSPDGWRLPYGPVADDEDWLAAGRRLGETLTDAKIAVDRVERVKRVTHSTKGDDREATSYDVVLRMRPVEGEPLGVDPTFGPWDELETEWFDAVPDDAHWDHDDAVDDIRLFVD